MKAHAVLVRQWFCRSAVLLVLAIVPVFADSTQEGVKEISDQDFPTKLSELLYLDSALVNNSIISVGERGYITEFDQQGSIVRAFRLDSGVLLTAVDFVSPLEGWVVGHDTTILYTADGGLSWTRQLIGRTNTESEKVLSDQTQLGYIPEASAVPVKDALFDINFINENHGFIVGAYGSFFVTSNAGKTWRDVRHLLDNEDGWHLYSICHVPDKSGRMLIAGEHGSIFSSDNFGATWNTVSSPYEGSFFGATCAQVDTLYIYGLKGKLFKSRDFGENWSEIKHESQAGLLTSLFMGEKGMLFAGNNGSLNLYNEVENTILEYEYHDRNSWSSAISLGEGRVLFSGEKGLRILSLREIFSDQAD